MAGKRRREHTALGKPVRTAAERRAAIVAMTAEPSSHRERLLRAVPEREARAERKAARLADKKARLGL